MAAEKNVLFCEAAVSHADYFKKRNLHHLAMIDELSAFRLSNGSSLDAPEFYAFLCLDLLKRVEADISLDDYIPDSLRVAL